MSKTKKPATVGKRIEEARLDYHMSQAQLGAMLKVTRAAVSQYEQDKIRPRHKVIARLAEVFGAAEEWFEHGRGEQPKAAEPLPIIIPEIEAAQIAPQANLRALATSREWTLPCGVLASDQVVAFRAPNDAGPVKAGDRVVVDMEQRRGVDAVYLHCTAADGVHLCECDGDCCEADILGRVVAIFRAL